MATARRRSAAAQASDDPISQEALERTADAMDDLADRALQSTKQDADNDLNAPIQSRAQAIKECATLVRKTVLDCTLVTTLVAHLESLNPEGRTGSQRTSSRRGRTPKNPSGHNAGAGKSGENDPGSGGDNPNDNRGGGGASFDGLSQ